MPPTLPPRPPHYWNDLLVAYLHDPPDKPLDIRGHESRARRYAEIAVGRELSDKEASTGASKWADIRASEIERLPLPNAGEKYHRAIGPEQGKLTVSHPLWSGGEAAHRIIHSRHGDELESVFKDVQEALRACVDGLRNPQARYLSLWRLLPDKLAAIDGAFQHLPAETRVPDHTIWQHLDTTAGLYTAYEGNDQLALLSLSIGPVQSFIAAARSVRDLWSGSMILSWLAFQGMQPILEQLGPTALVFPQLRANPMMDLWLREQFPELKDRLPEPPVAQRKSPCLPNRFVAIVPASEAQALAEACQQAVKAGWREIARAVHQHLHPTLKTFDPHWDSRWQQQVDHYFEVFTQTLAWVNHQDDSLARLYGGESFESVFKEAGALRTLERKMPEADRPGYRQDSVGRWQARVELLGRLLETRKQVRDQPGYIPQGPTPPKCSLLGTYEQMGPAKLSASADFWDDARHNLTGWTRLRSGERFSAIALIKRFAAEAFFCEALKLERRDLAIPDTATLTATEWLKKHGFQPERIREQHRDWSGQWLYAQQQKSKEEEIPSAVWQQIRLARQTELPPTYYSILMIDGDDMGRWLQGEKSPAVKQAYHPQIVEYFRKVHAGKILDNPRPVTPALHGAISEALANFALHVVPPIIAKHQGVLIYAGGDDVLALLPTTTALACAQELNAAFQGSPEVNGGAPQGYYRVGQREYLMMGPSATLSAGLAVVHYKEDLRHALALARDAEKHAKGQGRNALAITAARRSGEAATVLAGWDEIGWMQDWVKLFMPTDKQAALSNSWAYRLRDVMETLAAFGENLGPAKAEIKRQVSHLDNPDRLFRWFSDVPTLTASLRAAFDSAREDLGKGARVAKGELTGQAMADWFEEFHHRRLKRLELRAQAPKASNLLTETLPEFVILCQTLAFLARGREE